MVHPQRLLALAALCLATAEAGTKPECRGAKNEPVDWWMLFKHPTSYDYHYYEPGMSGIEIGDTLEAADTHLGATMQTLYESDEKQVAYAMWNDQFPNAKKYGAPRGHAKGVIAFDNTQGFWLTHSVPKFPQYRNVGWNTSWQVTSNRYAQSFMCVTLGDQQSIEKISQMLHLTWSSLYDTFVPEHMASDYPEFVQFVENKHIKTIDNKNSTFAEVKSKAGTSFTYFSKSDVCDCDFYEDVVAHALSSDMLTCTWQNGVGKMASSCGSEGYARNVENIVTVQFPYQGWKSTQDHSKWAITTPGSSSQQVTCMGGINRQDSMTGRGGDLLCSADATLYEAMTVVPDQIEQCM